jgi:hypothetical protein
MLDAQSSEDLAPLLQCRSKLRGTVRAEGWALAGKAEAQRNRRAMREHGRIFRQAPSTGVDCVRFGTRDDGWLIKRCWVIALGYDEPA